VPSVTDGVLFAAMENKYYRRVAGGTWEGFSQGDTRLHFRMMGLRDIVARGEAVSPVDAAIHRIQETQVVQYAGPLAGHKSGLREVNGVKILVTKDPVFPAPARGVFPVTRALLDNMFEWNSEQCNFLLGWLKYGYESYHYGKHRPGQIVAIAGEKDSGKSFIQGVLFTECFGGRTADPMRYMSGRSDFNSDLAAAEHLMIEDAVASTKLDVRRHFGSVSKQFAVNMKHSIHGKFVNALTLDPRWRVSITLNKEPENICGLPPLDESLEDKLALLLADKKPMPMPVSTLDEKEAFARTIRAEVPALCHWLLGWSPPAGQACPRFGVVAYHHPVMLEALQDQAPEIKLMALIDRCPVFKLAQGRDGLPAWGTDAVRVTAEEVEHALSSDDATRFSATRLFTWQNACGTYLGRLAGSPKYRGRVVKADSNRERAWLIYPPGTEPADQPF